jgi:hypothetical protein
LDEKTVKKIRKKNTEHGSATLETRDGKKYQVYAKLRNQVKNSVRKVKMSMERDILKISDFSFWFFGEDTAKEFR